jgi:hypothetical protein
MRFMIKFEIPNASGNTALKEGSFGERMQQYLSEIHAESAYFTTINGNRGGYIIVSCDDNASLIAICEPLFMWLNAKVEYSSVMNTDDLRKGNTYIQNAINKWSS